MRGSTRATLGVLLSGALFTSAACTSMVQPLGCRRPGARTPQPRSSNAEKAATKACATELVSVEARIARLDRARVRIREALAAAGFERTRSEERRVGKESDCMEG